MICDLPVKEPDLWAECIKNLITIGSGLIVAAYVAMAQFSREEGDSSEIENATFFSVVFPPNSGLGLILLIIACGLTTDNANNWMKLSSFGLFAIGCCLHGINLVRMYLWARESKTSNVFSGDGPRARYVRKWLASQNSSANGWKFKFLPKWWLAGNTLTSEEKARRVVQHFEVAGKAVSREDQRYATKLFQGTILQLYAKCYSPAAEGDQSPASLEALADRLRLMLYRSSQLLDLSSQDVEAWYSPDFAKKLLVGSRKFSDKSCSAIWAVRDHLTWMNARLSEADRNYDWLLVKYFDELITASEEDYKGVLLKDIDKVEALVGNAVFQTVFEAIGRVRIRQKVSSLDPLLEGRNGDPYAVYVRCAFVQYASQAVKRGHADAASSLACFCQSQLPKVSYGHLIRLIRLEEDIINVRASAFMDFCAKYQPGDDFRGLRFQGQELDADLDAKADAEYKFACDAARSLFLPFARFSRDRKYLKDMKDALVKLMDEGVVAKDIQKETRARRALDFIQEHESKLQAAEQPDRKE